MSTRPKLLVLGLGGIAWGDLVARISEQRLPGIEAVMRRGMAMRLIDDVPGNRAAAWATLSTGVLPHQHGIVATQEEWAGGLRTPGRASHAFAPLIDRLAAAGLRTRSVAWPFMRPGAAWPGVHVDDRYADAAARDWRDWPMPLDVAPEGVAAALEEIRVHPTDVTADLLRPFVPDLEGVDQQRDRTLVELAIAIARLSTNHAAAQLLLAGEAGGGGGVGAEDAGEGRHATGATEPGHAVAATAGSAGAGGTDAAGTARAVAEVAGSGGTNGIGGAGGSTYDAGVAGSGRAVAAMAGSAGGTDAAGIGSGRAVAETGGGGTGGITHEAGVAGTGHASAAMAAGAGAVWRTDGAGGADGTGNAAGVMREGAAGNAGGIGGIGTAGGAEETGNAAGARGAVADGAGSGTGGETGGGHPAETGGGDWDAAFVFHLWLADILERFAAPHPAHATIADAAWTLIDTLVAITLRAVPRDTLVVLVSPGRRGEAGFVAAAGGGLAPGMRSDVAHSVDLVPSLLAWFGMHDPQLGGRRLFADLPTPRIAPPARDLRVRAAPDGEALARVLAAGYRPPAPPPGFRARRLVTLATLALPHDPAGALRLAHQALAEGDEPVALGIAAAASVALEDVGALPAIAERIAAVAPGHVWESLVRGGWHALTGDAAGARPHLLRAEEQGGPDEWMRVGAAWLALDRPGDARGAFDRVLADAPGRVDALIGRAIAEMPVDRIAAEASLRRALAIDAASPQARTLLADLLRTTGRTREADTVAAAGARYGAGGAG